MKKFIKCGDGMFKPLTSISRIDTIEGCQNMYDIHFDDGNSIRFTDKENHIKDLIIT